MTPEEYERRPEVKEALKLVRKHRRSLITSGWASFKNRLMDLMGIPRDQYMKWDVPTEYIYAFKRVGRQPGERAWSKEDAFRQIVQPAIREGRVSLEGRRAVPQGFECVNPRLIRPIHGVRDKVLLDTLLASMNQDGWLGRPLLVVKDESLEAPYQYQGLTGSHRVQAAPFAGLEEIPVIVVPEPAAKIIKRSRYYPTFPSGISQDLFDHDESWLGRYILMDQWLQSLPQDPWSPEGLDWLRGLGHEDMIDVMAVRKWPCREELR